MAFDPRPKRTTRVYAKRLFNNYFNYAFLAGAAVLGLITGQIWVPLVAAGVETLFMLYAPDMWAVQKALDRVMDAEDEAEERKKRDAALRALSRADQVRCQTLLTKRAEIARLAGENPSFEGELLRRELAKLDKLVDSFIDLASTSSRYREYLDKEDVAEIERLSRGYEKEAQGAGSAAELAKKNLQIVMARLERLREIKEFCDRASGQLDLIENSFGLLADQIVSMRSPAELSGQLDELIDGVDAVRQTAREADRLLATT
jgi:hypothetical protein